MNYGVEIVYASAFTVACLVCAAIYNSLNRAYTYWDKKNIKGPKATYFIGTWKGISKKFLGYEDIANSKIFGKVWGAYDGFGPNLFVTDPKLIKEVLVTHADKFEDMRFACVNKSILKSSFLYLSGGEKPEVQSLTSYLLDRHKLDKLVSNLEKSVNVLVTLVSKQYDEGKIVEITSCVSDFINFAVGSVIFGFDFESDEKEKEIFLKNLKQTVYAEDSDGWIRLIPHLYTYKFKKQWIFSEEALDFFINLVSLPENEKSVNNDSSDENRRLSLIEIMEEAANEEKKLSKAADEIDNLVLTNDVIISKAIASLISLRSATRTIVTMGIHALAKNKPIQERLYKEIKSHKSQKINYEQIQSLGYLDKVIKEVMRLYPFEFRLERIALEPVTLGDISIEESVKVSIPLYALHRDEANYPEAENFNPERFGDEESAKRNPFTYLPFGQAGFNGSDFSLQLAVLASKVAILRLIENFSFSTVPDTASQGLFAKGFTGVPAPENLKLSVEKNT